MVRGSEKGYVHSMDYVGPYSPDVDGNIYGLVEEGVFINSVGRRSCVLNPRLGLGWRFPLGSLQSPHNRMGPISFQGKFNIRSHLYYTAALQLCYRLSSQGC